MKNDAILMDAMYNATTACTRGDHIKQEYAKGVLVGLVSAIMGQGATFGQAVGLLAKAREQAFWYAEEPQMDTCAIPECWRNEFKAYNIL